MTQRDNKLLDQYLREIGHEITISPEDERELAELISKGDAKAKERLVTSHLNLVIKIARRHADKGIELSDLVNEGNIGLIEAVGQFDVSRGVRFASFATRYIRKAILRAIATQSRTVSVPEKDVTRVNKINRMRTIFEQENERRPNINEIAEKAGIDESRIKSTMKASTRGTSIDAPIKEGGKTTLVDKLSDTDSDSTDELTSLEALRAEIKRSVTLLHQRERQVLSAYFGIGGEEMTLAEIAAKYGYTRERVRQIRKKGLRHLRSVTKDKALRSYLS